MNKKALWIVIVIVVGVVILVGLNSNKEKSFNVGLISILSGDYAAVGENFRDGVVLADEQYNAAHPNAPVKLTIEDDGFTGGKGVSAYEKLVNVDKIDGLINVSTPTIDSIYDKVTQNGMPVIQGGEQGREPADDNVFGIYPDSVSSEKDFGTYMHQKDVTKMTLVYSKIDAMVRFVNAFKEGFQGSTTDIVIDTSEKDFRTHALKAVATNPTNLGIFMVPQQGAQFIKEYFKLAKAKPAIFFDTNFVSGLTDYQRILSDLNILNGSIVGGMKLDTADSFKDAYKKRFGKDAGFLADIGYDAFNVLIESHAEDASTWVGNIKKLNTTGASGSIRFNATGNRLPDTKMMKIQDGALVDIK